MTQQKTYTIGELAQVADVTSRTVRYYVSEGLLPAPSGGGRTATYTQEHQARLQLIKILKDEYLPLQEIRTLLAGLDHEAVLELLAEKQAAETQTPDSAKSYLQTLLTPPSDETPSNLMRHKVKIQQQRSQKKKPVEKRKKETAASEQEGRQPLAPAMTAIPASMVTEGEAELEMEEEITSAQDVAEATEGAQVALNQTAASTAEPTPELPTRWQRIQITPEVELHVKEGLKDSSLWQKINHLIKISRQILNSMF